MNRLMDALEALPASVPWLGPFVVQHGYSRAPKGWRCYPFLEPAAQAGYIKDAAIVITHAGPATIAAVRSEFKVPIVVPRVRRYGEHVDDHQLAYARRLAKAGEVVLVEDVSMLDEAVRDYMRMWGNLPRPSPVDPHPAVAQFQEIASNLLRRRASH